MFNQRSTDAMRAWLARRSARRAGIPQRGSYMQSGIPGMRGTVNELMAPEIKYARGLRNRVTEPFLQQAMTPGSLFGAARTAAEGMGRELYKPGGVVATQMQNVMQESIGAGFDPSAAYRRQLGLIGAANDQISMSFAREASGLEQARFGGYANFVGGAQEAVPQAISNFYTGQGGIVSAEMAKKASQRKGGMFGLGIGPF